MNETKQIKIINLKHEIKAMFDSIPNIGEFDRILRDIESLSKDIQFEEDALRLKTFADNF